MSKPRLRLAGATEVAEILGVSRARVYQLMEREDFPPPLDSLACGTIWWRQEIVKYAKTRNTRTGRPPK
jgi:predicted DNA-binding transcriptional regulator AlpA